MMCLCAMRAIRMEHADPLASLLSGCKSGFEIDVIASVQAEKEHAEKKPKTDHSSAVPQLPAAAAADPAPDRNGSSSADVAMPDADQAPSSSTASNPHAGKMTGRTLCGCPSVPDLA